jgi:hypothetical protein
VVTRRPAERERAALGGLEREPGGPACRLERRLRRLSVRVEPRGVLDRPDPREIGRVVAALEVRVLRGSDDVRRLELLQGCDSTRILRMLPGRVEVLEVAVDQKLDRRPLRGDVAG